MQRLTYTGAVLAVLAFFIGNAWSEVQVHGFLSQGGILTKDVNYLDANSKSVSLEYRELGINFQDQVTDNLHVGMQILSRDVGAYGNGKVVIDWAYGDLYLYDALSIATGRVKNPVGFYSSIQDFDFLRTWAVLPTVLYDPGLRTLNSSVDGLQLHGNIDMSGAGNIDYTLTGGRVPLGPESDIGPYLKQFTPLPIDEASMNYLVAGNLVYNTPLDGFRINATYSYMDSLQFEDAYIPETFDGLVAMGGPELDLLALATLGTDIHQIVGGFQFTAEKFEVTAEWNHQIRIVRQGVFFPNGLTLPEPFASVPGVQDQVNQGLAAQEGVEERTESYGGGYLGVSVNLHEMWKVGGYYQFAIADYDEDLSESSNKNHDIALSLSFLPTMNMVMKLEGHYVDGTGGTSSALNPSGLADVDSWMYTVAKASFNF